MFDKDIPLPEPDTLIAKMRIMEIKDSFLEEPSRAQSIRVTASNAKISISIKPEGDKIRIWRTA